MRWQGSEDETPRRGREPLWADGYVVDTPYVDAVAFDLCPAWLSMASVLHGQPPIDRGRPLIWIDLGCGTGLSACTVAAANPDIEVWGFDHNPAHIERARNLAASAGLVNCRFEEVTFAELATGDRVGPPTADVIVVHGVYSWISAANQRHLVEVIRRRLRAGGLAQVMYEAPTGWSSMVPIAEALRLRAALDGRRRDLAFPDAAAAVLALADAGARSFPLGPREEIQMAAWSTANGGYAAHEYLGSHFAPLLFDEVAAAMADARCTFVGSIEVTDYLPAYWAPPELADLVIESNDPVLRELLRDLITQRPLRRDLFRRGVAAVSPLQHERWLRDLSVVGLGKPFTTEPVSLVSGSVALEPDFYVPLVGALESQALDIDTVLDIHAEWTSADAASALAMLVAGGFAAPAVPGPPGEHARMAARRMNEALIAENRLGADHAYLVTPATGAAIASEFVEMFVVGALWEGAEGDVAGLTDYVLDELAIQDRMIRDEGALVEDPLVAREIVERRVAEALQKMLGTHHRLGIY